MFFLVTVIYYYVELSKLKLSDVTNSVRKLVYLNFLGMSSAVTFAYLIVDFIMDFYNDSSLYFWGWFLVMTITVARSLWLNYLEFTPRKTDHIEK
ncbi:hypothetical protein MCM1_1537 [Methanosarcina barkeri CM1]|uniref:Uncharacterized protein n=1 Tax=Methanosarcina barkeri CM1 TaxID=796385 RepID=A0A0G3CHI2_METBA|nr:hypothetical protein MCM1_1537 [Methanosarcina barkeri CM1]